MKNIKKNIRHFFLLSGLAAGCMYGFNKLIETTSCIKKRLTVQDGYYFEWRYGKIFYTKHQIFTDNQFFILKHFFFKLKDHFIKI